MVRASKLKKLIVTKDTVQGKKKGILGLSREPNKVVYRVISSVNFRNRKWYLPTEIDYLMDIGIKIQFK